GDATNPASEGSGDGPDYQQLSGPDAKVWLDGETGEVLGKLTIPAGARAATLTVEPIDDSVVDPAEPVKVTLTDSPADSYPLDRVSTAAVSIDDNDGDPPAEPGPSGWYGPVISLRAADPHVAEEGGTAAFEVR